MNDDQLLRYSRHILLDEMGIPAQEKLLASTALIVGAGGLGSPAALYLAAAGLGNIVLADGDTVDLTNLQRQVLHTSDRIGQPKATSGAKTMRKINPQASVTAVTDRLQDDALDDAIAGATVVLDCCDNFETRHAVNRACVRHQVPLVSGAAIRFDGQLAVFDTRRDESPCYHCLFPESDDAEDIRCATMGVFAPLTGIIGTMQAAEALKVAGEFGTPITGKLQLLDARTMEWNEIAVPRDPACAVCASR